MRIITFKIVLRTHSYLSQTFSSHIDDKHWEKLEDTEVPFTCEMYKCAKMCVCVGGETGKEGAHERNFGHST